VSRRRSRFARGPDDGGPDNGGREDRVDGKQHVAQPVDATEPARPRQIGLDLLRMLAVALVLGRHLEPTRPSNPWPSQIVGSDVPADDVAGWAIPFELLRRGGWVGVDLFFVLSGFLVSGLLFGEYKARGRLGIGRFYLRRAWKILPPFLVLIAVTVAVNRPLGKLSGAKSPDARSLVAELTMLQNYLGGFWPHTWSLAVEEHFYLLLPAVLAALLAWNRRDQSAWKPFVALAIFPMALALVLRQNLWSSGAPFRFLTHHAPTHYRFDALFLGVALAYYHHFHTARFRELLAPRRRWLLVAGTLLLVPAFVWPQESPFTYTIGLTLFLIAGGLLTAGMVLCDFSGRGFPAAAASLGAYSYSIYLWHIPVREWVVPAVDHLCGGSLGFGPRSAVYLVGSLVGGVVMARLIELPLLRLRDRWFPRRAAGLAPES
jgi:peptidoglycan/LPS O-acetylase OafA/YrhL